MTTRSALAHFLPAIGSNGMQHWFSGRPYGPPRWIVVHGTAGGSSAEEIAQYFQTVQSSTHYVIGRDGTIIQCVDEADSAWGNAPAHSLAAERQASADPWWLAQNINPNFRTISIEHVKPSTDNADTLTPEQQAASFNLIEDICQRWNIPTDTLDAQGGICTHASIDPIDRAHCPGPYPFDALHAFLHPMPKLPDYAHDDPAAGVIHYDNTALTVHAGFREAILAGTVPWMGPPTTPELESNDVRLNGSNVEGHVQFLRYGILAWERSTGAIYAIQAGDLLYALTQKASSFDALTQAITGPAHD